MAAILAFCGIRPNPADARELVLSGLLKGLLEAPARLRPETAEGQAVAYAAIARTLAELLAEGRLMIAERPCLYIYEIEQGGHKCSGVWALTDLHNTVIKTHERTLAESNRRLQNYHSATGLEGSPVLLAYQPDQTIARIITQVKRRPQHTALGNSQGVHRIWEVTDREIQGKLIAAFAAIATIYLADGHHRLESAAGAGSPVLSSLYMAADQLRIREFDRVVLPEKRWSKAALIRRLAPNFQITPLKENELVRPAEPHRFGMLAGGRWYRLAARKPGDIGAAILQNQVLNTVFGISDPAADPRLKCVGGAGAPAELSGLVAERPDAIVFTVCPLTIEAILAVADTGAVLPPKSTWIDPKIPYGLILFQHETD